MKRLSKKDRYLELFKLAYEHTGNVDEARHMVAQMAHESKDLTDTEEDSAFSYERAKKVPFKSVQKMTEEEYNEIGVPTRSRPHLKGNKRKFFNAVYGGRLGNAKDEGYKYRGRGYIQLTGKNNWEKAGFNPEDYEGREMTPEEAFKVSTAYWDDHFPLKWDKDKTSILPRTKREVGDIINRGESEKKKRQRLKKYEEVERVAGEDIKKFLDAIEQRQKTKALDKEDMVNSLYPKAR